VISSVRRREKMTKLVVLVLCVCGLPLVMGAPSYDGILEAKRKELKALEQELDELVEKSQKADKYSSNSNEKVGGMAHLHLHTLPPFASMLFVT
jgi:cell division protein FtsB